MGPLRLRRFIRFPITVFTTLRTQVSRSWYGLCTAKPQSDSFCPFGRSSDWCVCFNLDAESAWKEVVALVRVYVILSARLDSSGGSARYGCSCLWTPLEQYGPLKAILAPLTKC